MTGTPAQVQTAGVARRCAASRAVLSLPAWLLLALSSLGCGGSDGSSTRTTADPTVDKLAQVRSRRTLVVSTDPAYPPQSYQLEHRGRNPDTRCAANQLTSSQFRGYDVETAVAVARHLGVEPCFVTPPFREVTAGRWGDRWDISIGSMDITEQRLRLFYVTQPYYATPQYFFVRKDSSARDVEDLSGKRIGACTNCIHEEYLRGILRLPGQRIVFRVKRPRIVGFDTEPPGLAALAKRRVDAFLAAEQVGLEAIKLGRPLRKLGRPVFYAYSVGAVDRASRLRSRLFVGRVNEIIRTLHRDGTLKALSRKYFGVDYTTSAARFDVGSIRQQIP